MSGDSDLKEIIQKQIIGAGKVLVVQKCQLLGNFDSDSFCILSLIERERSFHTEHAVFVFTPIDPSHPPDSTNNLVCNQVLPIDKQFLCDILPNEEASDVRLHLRDSGRVSVYVVLNKDDVNPDFIGEIFRVIDLFDGVREEEPEWSNLCKALYDGREGIPLAIPGIKFRDNPVNKNYDDAVCGLEAIDIGNRESKMKLLLAAKAPEYTFTNNFRILVATWNVNGKPPTTSLIDWLTPDDEDPPDIYAIGFQELDLSKDAFLRNETAKEGEWLEAVTITLQTRGIIYEKIALVRLVGVMMLVYVKKAHCPYVKNVCTESVGTGIMNFLGNKGGVACRFDFHSTSLCFVNSHLAAHVEEFERRNQDYNSINSRLAFNLNGRKVSISHHDQIYWMGDLNYRVNSTDVEIKELLLAQNFKAILEYDQLNISKKRRLAFDGYLEGKITFQPTYKYDTGTDLWDTSEKNRAPAWCDRVLWKGTGIQQIKYRSHPSLKISDHKPVSSLFNTEIRIIDEKKMRKVQEDLIKVLDRYENDFSPHVTVDTTEIDFPLVKFLEPIQKELIIANTGQVPAHFEFIKKLDDPGICKVWLNVDPVEKCIMPGEKCDVILKIHVDKKSSSRLNSGADKIYDILILHVDRGKDIFITITGNYEPSCFGCSIEALVRIPVPIREIPFSKLIELENNKDFLTRTEPSPIPKEIWFLTDNLHRKGLKQNLFFTPGLLSEIIQIRNWLDNGSSEAMPGSPYSMAEALLLLLDSTPEPVVPYNLIHVCANACGNYLKCKEIIQSLPIHRRNLFLYLCMFLQELLNYSSDNRLEAKDLALLFGQIFLRGPPSRKEEKNGYSQQELDRKKCNFVYQFLVNDQSEFILGR